MSILPLLALALVPPPAAPVPGWVVDTVVLAPGRTLAAVLYGIDGLPADDAREAIAALAPLVDLRKTRAGDAVRVERRDGRLSFLELSGGPTASFAVRREGGRLVGESRVLPVRTRVVDVDATLKSSLWQAFTDAGEEPQLAMAIADVLAWDVDFYADPRPGDRIRAVVERREAGGKVVGYGEVLAAEYRGAVGDRQVYRYVDRQGRPGYYDAGGHPARRAFLKSPLVFSRISSSFGMRMHPTLHYRKKHEGVDYVAPTGTPVWAVGDGTVLAAGYKGANGNYVGIRHPSGLATFYCHLSRIASGIRAGVHVLQKRVIGYVGMTGRATGPHLHFALKRNGRFVNPLAFRAPKAAPLSSRELTSFRAMIAPLARRLLGVDLASMAAVPVATAIR